MVSYIIISVVCLVLLAADQITKVIIDTNYLEGQVVSVVIKDFFSITKVHNTGAAWGIFDNATLLLAIFSLILAAFIFFAFLQVKPALLKLAAGLIFVGAIGNVVDRFRLGYVVDFLSFRLFGFYDFPVFNVADICVVSGTIGIMIFLLFYSSKTRAFREGTVLSRLFSGKNKKTDTPPAEETTEENRDQL